MRSSAPRRASRPANPYSIEAIAQRLVATREALGLSQAEFCRRAGVAANTYNQWEMAKGRPSIDGATKIADEFDLTLDWIYRGKIDQQRHDLVLAIREKMPIPPDEPSG